MVPSTCRKKKYDVYLRAYCKSDYIRVPLIDKEVKKENVALLVVLMDILIGVIAVLSFTCLDFFQEFEYKEIIETTISGDDFAV
jgi:hypothetical protein